jgi:recombination protein RecA
VTKKTQTTTNGKLSIAELRSMINRKAGTEVSFDLLESNPTEVTEWIPTGSDVLNSIICRGKKAGIPVGRISELAGIEGSGKSFYAAQIASNAQKMGITVVYFDSESALDPEFLKKAGCDVSSILYTQATSIEFVMETIEELLGSPDADRFLFILDSFAFTPCKTDLEGDFNPQSSMAMKPRIMSKGLSKIIQPIANKRSTFLVLNQLKQNIVVGQNAHVEMMINPWITSGGRALSYSYSLRVWLTPKKSKASYIVSETGFRIGSETKCVIKKSRFGTEGRECSLKLLWGGETIKVSDDEAWLDILTTRSNRVVKSGHGYIVKLLDGKERKFKSATFAEDLNDPDFRATVQSIVDEEMITKFDKQTGSASSFYDIDRAKQVEEESESAK